jgi:hypothetical protein
MNIVWVSLCKLCNTYSIPTGNSNWLTPNTVPLQQHAWCLSVAVYLYSKQGQWRKHFITPKDSHSLLQVVVEVSSVLSLLNICKIIRYFIQADRSGLGVLRRECWSLGYWDCEFVSRWRHGCPSSSFCVVLSSGGRGLSSGWSPVQGALLTVEVFYNFISNSELEHVTRHNP